MFGKQFDRIVTFAILALLSMAVAVSGCAQPGPSPAATATPAPANVTVKDMAGNAVIIPGTIDRIVVTCYGGASHEIAVLGGSDKIVGQPPMQRFPGLIKIYPGLNNTTNAGSFNNVNVEAVLSLRPDVAIAPKSSTQGNKAMADAGIPVVTVSAGSGNITTLMQEFHMMGQVLNKTDQSDALVSYWDDRLKMIDDRLSGVPADQRKRVYYMLGGFYHTNGGNLWGQDFITASGGINVAQDFGPGEDLDAEQLLKWDPDVIIISSNEGNFTTVAQVKNNAQISGLKAVKSDKLYECPIGTFWWDRPSPEAVLGIEWLATTLYPDQFSDINMVNETRDFYRTFYDYNLTDEEANAFLNPQP